MKRNQVVIALAVIAAIAIAAPAIGLSGSIKKAIKKEVSKQLSTKTGPAGPAGAPGATGPAGPSGLAGTVGRSNFNDGACNDDDQNGEDCVSVSVTLPQTGRVLLTGTANWRTAVFDDMSGVNNATDDINEAEGICALTADDAPVANSTVEIGEVQGGADTTWTDGDVVDTGAQVTTTAVTASLPAGSHTFEVRCTEVDGDVDFDDALISAVSLGNG